MGKRRGCGYKIRWNGGYVRGVKPRRKRDRMGRERVLIVLLVFFFYEKEKIRGEEKEIELKMEGVNKELRRKMLMAKT